MVETHSFPTCTSTFINNPFSLEGRLSQLKTEKICTKNMWKRDRNVEKTEKLRIYLSLSLSLSHTQADGQKNTSADWIPLLSAETGSVQVKCDTILCDLIIRLLPRCSYTTSLFHYRGSRGGAGMCSSWGSHESWLGLDERSESLHPSSFRILLMLQWRWEVHLCTGSVHSSISQESLGSSPDGNEGLTHPVDILLQISLVQKYSVRPSKVATLPDAALKACQHLQYVSMKLHISVIGVFIVNYHIWGLQNKYIKDHVVHW